MSTMIVDRISKAPASRSGPVPVMISGADQRKPNLCGNGNRLSKGTIAKLTDGLEGHLYHHGGGPVVAVV